MSSINTAATILVVDDNQVVLTAMTITLRPTGCRVLTASTGAEALRLVHQEDPSLILLDLAFAPDASNLGGSLRDGFEIIEWLHHMDEARDTPVIIISSTEPAKYHERAQAAGVVACFQKPVDKQKLLEAVREVLASKLPTQPDMTTVFADFEV